MIVLKPTMFWSHFSIDGRGMISPSLNHVFVIVHGVLYDLLRNILPVCASATDVVAC